MLSWILLTIIIALVCVIGLMISSRVFGRGEALEPLPPSADIIEGNRRAVEAGDLDGITLEVVHRGYRMDQVDALVEQLAAQRGVVQGAAPGAGRRAERASQPAAHAGQNGVDCYETETTRVEHD